MDEKLSDEDLLAETQRAIRLCADDDEREQFTMTHREARLLDAAVDRGAAAIAAQKELVDALEESVRDYWSQGVSPLGDAEIMAADVLVKHGRMVKDGDSYRWSKP